MPKTKPERDVDRVLVGTSHVGGTHRDVIDALRPYNFSSLGIEATSDALEKGERKPDEYFIPIISYYKNRGVTIVPLDLSVTWQAHEAGLMVAATLAIGDTNIRKLNQAIEKVRLEYLHSGGRSMPSLVANLSFAEKLKNGIRQYREKGADAVLEEWRALSRQREDHMVSVILENDIPINIIGAGHVVEILPRLPGYLSIYPDKNPRPLLPQLQSSYIPSRGNTV